MSLVSRLAAHDWPGNVRELRNAVRKLVIASRGRTVAELPATLVRRMEARMRDREDDNQDEPTRDEVRDGTEGQGSSRLLRRVADITDQEILDTIHDSGGDKKEASRRLGISRTTLYKRINASELLREALDPDLDE
jgi:DNA-binding NtrC family response regulator